MIISLDPTDLLIVEHWNPLRIIPAISKGNIEKYYILPHPEFNEYEFPFLVCSGVYFYVLINVQNFKLDKFIDQSCGCVRA